MEDGPRELDGDDRGAKRPRGAVDILSYEEYRSAKQYGESEESIDKLVQRRLVGEYLEDLRDKEENARKKQELADERAARVASCRVLTYRQIEGDLFSPPARGEWDEPIMHWQQLLWKEFQHYEHPSRRTDGAQVVTEATRGFFKMINQSPPINKDVYLRRLKAVYARLLVDSSARELAALADVEQ